MMQHASKIAAAITDTRTIATIAPVESLRLSEDAAVGVVVGVGVEHPYRVVHASIAEALVREVGVMEEAESDIEGVEVNGAVTDEGEADAELSGGDVDGTLEAGVAPEETDIGIPLDVANDDGEAVAEAVSLAPEVSSDADGEGVSVPTLDAAPVADVRVAPGGGLVLPP